MTGKLTGERKLQIWVSHERSPELQIPRLRDDKKERIVVRRGRLLKEGVVPNGCPAPTTAALSLGNCPLFTTILSFLSSRASDLPVASHRQVKRGMNWETSDPFDTRVPSPLATALSLSTTLSYLSFRAKRGACGAPRSLPDSQGQTYRQFKPSLFVPRHHCFYLRTHFVH